MGMREKLIELIKQKSCAYVTCDRECGECRNVEMYDDAIEAIADHLIANGVTIQKWIPVTERLPDKTGEVLVCTVHECYKIANVAKATFKKHSGGFYGGGGHWSNVTHWMPLPEAPKGGD